MIVFDTGAFVGLERRKQRMLEVWATARALERPVLTPSVVVGEWWRGRTDRREAMLAGVRVVAVDEALAKLSGEALAAVPGATLVDAVVMALAARYDGVVYTSDLDDLERLRAYFPGVRVLTT